MYNGRLACPSENRHADALREVAYRASSPRTCSLFIAYLAMCRRHRNVVRTRRRRVWRIMTAEGAARRVPHQMVIVSSWRRGHYDENEMGRGVTRGQGGKCDAGDCF